jgi:hypothetical protein
MLWTVSEIPKKGTDRSRGRIMWRLRSDAFREKADM